jgi:hypothetical protein
MPDRSIAGGLTFRVEMESGHVTSRLTMLLDTFSVYGRMSSEKLLRRYVMKDTVCKLQKNQSRKSKGTLISGFDGAFMSCLLETMHNTCDYEGRTRPFDSKSKKSG